MASTATNVTSQAKANQPMIGGSYRPMMWSGGSTANGPKWTALTNSAPPPEMKARIAAAVTAPPGTTLLYLCAIHPWMQGEITVK
jgi:hypothetical protein